MRSWFIILLFGVMMPMISAEETITGCEVINSTVLKCWNQGTIENTTYFHRGGIQQTNALDRWSWAEYGFGIAWYNNQQELERYDFDFSDYNKLWQTNNNSYYYLEWEGQESVGGKVMNITYRAGQYVTDDLVTFDLTMEAVSGWEDWNKTLYLFREMKNINIDNDGDHDVINWYNTSGWQGQYINGTGTEILGNIDKKRLTLGDLDNSMAIGWKWDSDDYFIVLDEQAQHYQQRVGLIKGFDGVSNGASKTVTHKWIDAEECTKACGPGVVLAFHKMLCAADDSAVQCSADVNQNIEFYFKLQFSCFFSPCWCSYGTGCYIQGEDKNPVFPYHETANKNNVTTEDIVCDSWTKPSCKQDTIQHIPLTSTSKTRLFNITCRQDDAAAWRSRGYFIFENKYSANNIKTLCNADTGAPNITLVAPDNATTVTSPAEHECNATDDYSITNITFWSNSSGTWALKDTDITFPDTEGILTYDQTVTETTCYEWNCAAQDLEGNVGWADDNYTVCVEPKIDDIEGFNKFLTLPPKAEKILPPLAALSVGFWLVPLWLRRKKNNEEEA